MLSYFLLQIKLTGHKDYFYIHLFKILRSRRFLSHCFQRTEEQPFLIFKYRQRRKLGLPSIFLAKATWASILAKQLRDKSERTNPAFFYASLAALKWAQLWPPGVDHVLSAQLQPLNSLFSLCSFWLLSKAPGDGGLRHLSPSSSTGGRTILACVLFVKAVSGVS